DTEQTRLRVARLRTGRHCTYFDKPKAQGAERVEVIPIFIQPCRQSHRVGKTQAHHLYRVVGRRRDKQVQQLQSLSCSQHIEAEFVGNFRVKAEQEVSERSVHKYLYRQLNG